MNGGVAVNVEGRRRFAIGAVVAAAHVGALIWLGVSVVPVLPEVTTQALDVVLMRAPPRPAEEPSPVSAGGMPAAPSTVHAPPEARPEAVELTAPIEPAPLQPLVLGFAPLTSPVPSTGDGGVGTGSGGGVGAGEGPGVGGGSGAVLITGPTGAVMTRDVEQAALIRAGYPHVIMRCQIRLNQRLENCRVIGEHPRPSGHRQAALQRVREFRFRPPQRLGRPLDRRLVVVGIAFPHPEPDPATAPVDGN